MRRREVQECITMVVYFKGFEVEIKAVGGETTDALLEASEKQLIL